jgi:ATP-dependent DNA helicase RecQ
VPARTRVSRVVPSADDELRRLAVETFGWPRLHDEQLRAMRHVMAGHDVLVVLPTGAGKSAIYQVPALLLDGPTVVVSPLIALQYDQIGGIEDSRAPQGVALNSTQSAAERDQAWRSMREGSAEYLFLSPEQLLRPDVLDDLTRLGVGLFVVDEAHCVSEWGHDFRPDYLRLASIIERLGHPRVVALTATAAPPVRRDIAARLGLRDPAEVVASFDRPNLHLAVQRFTDEAGKRTTSLERIRELAGHSGTGAGLVYTASRKDAECHAAELADSGVRAEAYHAGMAPAHRERVHERFLSGELVVVVATSAFGMGIDKPDVRFVVHTSVQDSLDSYYQQIGRAGRDDEPAEILLCYRTEDLALQRFLTGRGAQENTVRAVVGALIDQREPVSESWLKKAVDASPGRRTRAVNLLEQTGTITVRADGRLAYTAEGMSADEVVRKAVVAAENHQRLVASRLEMVRGYAEASGCRRQYLLGYFGEQLDVPCGNCDNCAAGAGRSREPGAADAEYPLGGSVRHAEWGHGSVLSVEPDRLTVLFDEQGYKTLSLRQVREHRLLTTEAD